MPIVNKPSSIAADRLKAIVVNEDGGWGISAWNLPRNSQRWWATIRSDRAVKETDRREGARAGS